MRLRGRRRSAADLHTLIAYAMCAIALCGAVAAYLSGTAEHEVLQQERILAQARMFALKLEQEMRDGEQFASRIRNRMERYRSEAERLTTAAQNVKSSTSFLNKIEAAQALTAARLWIPLDEFFGRSVGSIRDSVEFRLSELGFDVQEESATPLDALSMFEAYQERIARHHDEFRWRAGMAVSCVLLLVCLTLMSLGARTRWFARAARIGFAISLAFSAIGVLVLIVTSLKIREISSTQLVLLTLMFVAFPAIAFMMGSSGRDLRDVRRIGSRA